MEKPTKKEKSISGLRRALWQFGCDDFLLFWAIAIMYFPVALYSALFEKDYIDYPMDYKEDQTTK